jgi:hypothetical protein
LGFSRLDGRIPDGLTIIPLSYHENLNVVAHKEATV